MASNLLYFHSILRYFILFFALLVLIQSITGMITKRNFRKNDKNASLILMILCDVQLLVGIFNLMAGGWFGKIPGGGMKDHYIRFFAVEHPMAMVIALVLIHIGYAGVKKAMEDAKKFKRLFWCTLISLFIFLTMIPWPTNKEVGRPFLPQTGQMN